MKSYCEKNYICAHCGKVVCGDPDINKCTCCKEWEEQIDINNECKETITEDC